MWTLITVHVAAVVFISYFSGDNLIRAMWTGRKEDPSGFMKPGDEELVPEDIPPTGVLRVILSLTVGVSAILVFVL